MLYNIFWSTLRILAVFGLTVYVISPTWDWLGGDGWEITQRAYIRGTKAAIGMLIFELLRYRRTRRGSALNRR